MDDNWRLCWNNPWSSSNLTAFHAHRYVIAVKSERYYTKLFQIAFGSDGTVFVTMPYNGSMLGRLGLLNLSRTVTYPTNIKFGENCPITSHAVKYSHHPSGRAHFSLTGKIRSDIGKQSAPLHKANGHLFTVMTQGVHLFDAVAHDEKSTKKRGIVPFGLSDPLPDAVKFVAHLYSRTECGRRFVGNSKIPWNIVVFPDGRKLMGILLATPFSHEGEPYYLQLTLESIPRINKDNDVFVSFVGGFDEPSVAFDHTKDTSLLVCLYPQTGDISELVNTFGTVDVPFAK